LIKIKDFSVLSGQAAKFGEPILLVGETGCGKTTIVQYLAAIIGAELRTVNCHMHSESADFLGGLRPVRSHGENAPMDGDFHDVVVPASSNNEDGKNSHGKLFEWVEGPLVTAMKNGEYFLADEISLADDSVLERLNSVLGQSIELYLSLKVVLIAVAQNFIFH
jgi:midasin